MTQINNPLHGMTLEQVINSLVDKYGWDLLMIQVLNPALNFCVKHLGHVKKWKRYMSKW